MKKTLTIVALSLVAVIVITTIVLGFVNKDFKQLDVSAAQSLEVYKDGKKNTYYKQNDQTGTSVYQDVTKLYNNSSKMSILSALFTGAFSVDAEIINENTTVANKTSSGYWISYEFDEAQTLKLNGKDYYDTAENGQKVTFTKMLLQVTNTQGMQLVNCYICETVTAVQAKYTLTIYADLTDLYEYVSNLTIA